MDIDANITKKKVNEVGRVIRNACLKNPGYEQWKVDLYQEPDGFLHNCERNYHLLLNCIPTEAMSYFEKNNPWLPGKDFETLEGATQWFLRARDEMLAFAPQILENIKQSMTMGQGQTFYMYHWLLNDNGDIELVRLLCKNLDKGLLGFFASPFIHVLVSQMVRVSIEQYITSKSGWKRQLSKFDDADAHDAIKETLTTTSSTNHGRDTNDVELFDLLIGNKQALMGAIADEVRKRETDTQLGCLLYALVRTKCVEYPCEYSPFHRALQTAFPDANIGGEDCPAGMFGKIRDKNEDFSCLGKRQRNKLKAVYLQYCDLFKQVNS